MDGGVVTRSRVSKIRLLQEYIRRKNAMRATNNVCPFTQDRIPTADAFVLVEEPRPGQPGPGTVYRFNAKHFGDWVRIKEVNPFTNTPLNAVELSRLRRMRASEESLEPQLPENTELLAFFDGELGRIVEEYMVFAEQDCFEFCEARMRAYTLHPLIVIVRQFAEFHAEACIQSLEHAIEVCIGPPNYRRQASDMRSITLVVGILLRLKGMLIPGEDHDTEDDDSEDEDDIVVEETETETETEA